MPADKHFRSIRNARLAHRVLTSNNMLAQHRCAQDKHLRSILNATSNNMLAQQRRVLTGTGSAWLPGYARQAYERHFEKQHQKRSDFINGRLRPPFRAAL